jgi:hypothetical protein
MHDEANPFGKIDSLENCHMSESRKGAIVLLRSSAGSSDGFRTRCQVSTRALGSFLHFKANNGFGNHLE